MSDIVTPRGRTRPAGWSFETVNHHVLAMWVFISSEVFFFGSLIGTYVAYRGASLTGPTPAEVLDIPRTAIFTVFLLASSATVTVAIGRLHRGDQTGFRFWLIATILLGAIFLAGQVSEYAALYQEGITINRNPFTAAFYTLTGFHGLHVLGGLVSLMIAAGLALAGDFGPRRDTAIEVISLYWHFVDVVWIVVFSVVYLWALIG